MTVTLRYLRLIDIETSAGAFLLLVHERSDGTEVASFGRRTEGGSVQLLIGLPWPFSEYPAWVQELEHALNLKVEVLKRRKSSNVVPLRRSQ